MHPLITVRRQPDWVVLLEDLDLVGLIGWFEHHAGWEWSGFALPLNRAASRKQFPTDDPG
ncbi:MAG: hypothetical protein EXS33_06115 [Pedosphaera sp.]|nr:hypothetical protein [Pedosphaera sp.]